jgi:ATP phosphoribosyltransferase regulatory subunit
MEEIRAALISIYKNRGFTQIFPSRVEEYGLYMENQNFFKGECAAAFMGKSGKLLTFKPDTTLSIINGLKSETCAQKLFYIDEIARSGRNTDFNFITQIGIEIIDSGDSYFSSAEAVDMALESLRSVGAKSALDISHQGFLNGLFDALKITDRRGAIDALRAKNENALPAALKEICSISEPLGFALSKIKKFDLNETAKLALEELEFLNKIFKNQNLALDFSATGDLDYYNGLILRGYVEGIPAAVLTGGRYDNLLSKMNKKGGAIGFAVSLSAAPLPVAEFDSDILIYFDSNSDFQKILQMEKKLRFEGKSVRLANINENFAWKAQTIIKSFDY